MHISFYGATREVTGSMHMVSAGENRVLLDCGMFQGRRKESEQKNRVFPIDSRVITNVVLSHAHIDHSGRIPLLTRNGFNGHVIYVPVPLLMPAEHSCRTAGIFRSRMHSI
jgi:metallo-beta-lactamase family protein